ncbi:hypothetical protein FACS1894187_04950 [Synergistales bacterium]|nr:hypothetical protein FACS1894187_04950 [Synergistales bacterium]
MQVWQPCPSYNTGDIVTYAGHIWEAKAQSAGKEPNNPNNTGYWKDLGELAATGDVRHDDTTEKHGTSATEFNHLSDNEADAALYAHNPSQTNPFLTASQIAPLYVHIGDFVKQSDLSAIVYDALFDDAEQAVIAVGDNVVTRIDPTDMSTEVFSAFGNWRGVTKLGSDFVAVGKDSAAYGDFHNMQLGAIPSGHWKSVAAGNAKAVAVGDGRAAVSTDGQSWTAQDMPVGFGDDIVFNDYDNRFYAVGRLGAKSSADGIAWTDETLAAGTWRAVARGNERLVAVSGKVAVKEDGGDWVVSDMPFGGWEDVCAGDGFMVAAGNNIAAVSPDRSADFGSAAVPDFIYTTVVFGAGKFWLLGSAVVTADVVDTAAALNGANNPSSGNPYATIADLASVNAALLTTVNGLQAIVIGLQSAVNNLLTGIDGGGVNG